MGIKLLHLLWILLYSFPSWGSVHLGTRSPSVQDDWCAWLPREKDQVYSGFVRQLESSYYMFSVALDEALVALGGVVKAEVGDVVAGRRFEDLAYLGSSLRIFPGVMPRNSARMWRSQTTARPRNDLERDRMLSRKPIDTDRAPARIKRQYRQSGLHG